jgi:hypothetical protein
MAEDSFAPGGSPLYARLAREHADEPALERIAGAHRPTWDAVLRVFGGVHLLALRGEVEDPWSRFGDVLDEREEWLAGFVSRQPVQTNEVQRAWALLPAFLTVADERPLDLVELGPSAGLNLAWDRYRYRYGDAAWGPPGAGLELAGEASGGPPPSLFARRPHVRGRLGIDREPVDVTRDDDALLLQAFVWPDQAARLERLRRAIALVRGDPPRLLRGDYVDLLPAVLAERDPEALTVVFHSASTSYLPRERRTRLAETIEGAGSDGSLAWVSYEFVDDDDASASFETFALDARVWPPGEPRRLARLDGHGNRMRWLS